MLSHALRAAAGQGTTPTPTDPNFNQVSLLLHGDGTNGAQNNTFLDSSTNNFTITRNGNTTQGTNTPFSQDAGYWSNNTTSGTISVPDNTAFDFGSGDFTIEMWAYLNASTPSGTLAKGTSFMPFAFYFGGSELAFYSSSNGTSWDIASNRQFVSPVPRDVWNHYAVTRSGTTFRTFYNGVVTNTWTSSATLVTNSSAVSIGNFGSGNNWQGYLSNVRLVKGTAVYTSAFTPPTTPLTAITNTSLLTCQSSYFKDNSSNNFAITATGTPSVQPFSPFAPTSAYSTSVNGGSMYFDGTGDYLKTPSNIALGMGTSDFTMEGWLYLPAYPSAGNFMVPIDNSSADPQVSPDFYINSAGLLRYYVSGANAITSSAAVPLNSWFHFALSRSGTSTKLFINGTQTGSTYTDTNNYVTNPVTIGAYFDGTETLSGYISNIRIVKGTAVYTTTFTPPTAPLTAITNTSLLLSGTNAGIYDNAIKNDLETVGNAQVSTSVVKYGTGSMKFNGTTDYLTAPTSPQFAFGTGAWTIEGWVYPNSVTALQSLIDTRATATSTTGVLVSITALGFISVTVNNAILFTSSTAMTISAWTHVAVVQNGTTITLYLNGTKPTTGSGTSSTSLTDQYLRLGASAGTAANFYNGYLDDVRITKGIARYTANFTAPTSAFPNQ